MSLRRLTTLVLFLSLLTGEALRLGADGCSCGTVSARPCCAAMGAGAACTMHGGRGACSLRTNFGSAQMLRSHQEMSPRLAVASRSLTPLLPDLAARLAEWAYDPPASLNPLPETPPPRFLQAV